MKLVVTRQFADHKVGDEITDPALVDEILSDVRRACVVKVASAEAPHALTPTNTPQAATE